MEAEAPRVEISNSEGGQNNDTVEIPEPAPYYRTDNIKSADYNIFLQFYFRKTSDQELIRYTLIVQSTKLRLK